MDGIKKETWLKAKPEVRQEMMFDMQLSTHDDLKILKDDFAARKVKDRTFSGFTGFIGGYIASLFR